MILATRLSSPAKLTLLFSSLVFITAILLPALPAKAEIYKYKDANGKWQFTDKKPLDKAIKATTIKTNKNEVAGKDLDSLLNEKYKVNSPIEATTLSVVTVKTLMGSGSGFFVSDNGYIVTNKHVVRPQVTNKNKQLLEKMERAEEQMKNWRIRLDREKSRLSRDSKRLKEFKARIDSTGNEKRKSENTAEYNGLLKTYKARKKVYESNRSDYNTRKKQHDKRMSDFKWRNANASASRRFDIVLKDNSEYTATLVKLSAEHDLALLKIHGHKTPFLELDIYSRPAQGMEVYAVGSPLGRQDYVTSGILTNIKARELVTDTQILPGNSGGPLVNKNGNVIGVNTRKLLSTSSIGSEGFGMAIRSRIVHQEFSHHYKKPDKEAEDDKESSSSSASSG